MRLSKKEKCEKILQYADSYYARYGKSPTIREIAQHASISCGSVHNYLWEMEDAGIIEYDSQTILTPQVRALRSGCIRVPIVGFVACGMPDSSDPLPDEYMDLPLDLLDKTKDLYLFYADGDSMIGAGIFDGDMVLIHKQEEAYPGKIVLAEVEGEGYTLKRYMRKGRRMVLHPENPEMEDIEPDFFKIRGVALKAIKDL